MDPEFAQKSFFVSENFEWFEKQVRFVQIELGEAYSVVEVIMLKIENNRLKMTS